MFILPKMVIAIILLIGVFVSRRKLGTAMAETKNLAIQEANDNAVAYLATVGVTQDFIRAGKEERQFSNPRLHHLFPPLLRVPTVKASLIFDSLPLELEQPDEVVLYNYKVSGLMDNRDTKIAQCLRCY